MADYRDVGPRSVVSNQVKQRLYEDSTVERVTDVIF